MANWLLMAIFGLRLDLLIWIRDWTKTLLHQMTVTDGRSANLISDLRQMKVFSECPPFYM